MNSKFSFIRIYTGIQYIFTYVSVYYSCMCGNISGGNLKATTHKTSEYLVKPSQVLEFVCIGIQC